MSSDSHQPEKECGLFCMTVNRKSLTEPFSSKTDCHGHEFMGAGLFKQVGWFSGGNVIKVIKMELSDFRGLL